MAEYKFQWVPKDLPKWLKITVDGKEDLEATRIMHENRDSRLMQIAMVSKHLMVAHEDESFRNLLGGIEQFMATQNLDDCQFSSNDIKDFYRPRPI